MPLSIYSWMLNRIRLGDSQVESFNRGRDRFSNLSREEVYKSWLAAWSGKYTAEYAANNPDMTFDDVMSQRPRSARFPRTNASSEVIRRWYPEIVDAPHDFNITYNRAKGAFSEFGQWRFETSGDDTYTMIINTALGELRRQYKLDDNDEADFIGEIFIGTVKP